VGGAYADTPTLSVSGDVDNDGRVESIFAIGSTLYVVGANPGGTSGQIEWTFTPDNGLLGSPILADGNGDGRAEIIVVSTSGRIYGIGKPAAPSLAAHIDETSGTTRVASGGDGSLSQRSFQSELINRTRMPTFLRQMTPNEDSRQISDLLLISTLGRVPAREEAFAEFAVEGRINAAGKRESLSTSGWHLLPDHAFTSDSRFTP
jgi:hypothetical protein